jgi:hypothetical protein
MSAASGLDGILEPLSRCLDAESARRVVDFQVDRPVQERIDALAKLANEGRLATRTLGIRGADQRGGFCFDS